MLILHFPKPTAEWCTKTCMDIGRECAVVRIPVKPTVACPRCPNREHKK